jgi:predicted nucleic acid-binding Zn ribbon protein
LRRSKTISLSEALGDYIKEMKLERGLSEIHLLNSWEEIVGKAISSRTKNIYIKDQILFVRLDSSVVRNELLMLRESIKARLNEKAGSQVIKEIVLL